MEARLKELELYTELEKIFVSCVKDAISKACEAKWGKDWFQELVKFDNKNTQEKNQTCKNGTASGRRPVSNITERISNIEGFDLQACNKTMVYLKEIKDTVYQYYAVSEADQKQSELDFRSLIDFRNKNAHSNYQEHPEEDKDREKAVDHMSSIIRYALKNVIPFNEPGRCYLDLYQDWQAKYIRAHHELKEQMTKYFPEDQYNPERFLNACSNLQIRTIRENGILYFFSSNLEKDVESLKNLMSGDRDDKQFGSVEQHQTFDVQQKKPDFKKLAIILSSVLALCAVVIAVLVSLAHPSQQNIVHKEDGGNTHQAASKETEHSQSDNAFDIQKFAEDFNQKIQTDDDSFKEFFVNTPPDTIEAERKGIKEILEITDRYTTMKVGEYGEHHFYGIVYYMVSGKHPNTSTKYFTCYFPVKKQNKKYLIDLSSETVQKGDREWLPSLYPKEFQTANCQMLFSRLLPTTPSTVYFDGAIYIESQCAWENPDGSIDLMVILLNGTDQNIQYQQMSIDLTINQQEIVSSQYKVDFTVKSKSNKTYLLHIPAEDVLAHFKSWDIGESHIQGIYI